MHALGSNHSIPSFPVGARLAFDANRGRLWVACKSCGRWNLTPIETRSEIIEDCERLYRATHTRLATTHIGLARLRDGTELIRIGTPLRPEFAAWRYGDKFINRRKKQLALTGVGIAAAGSVAVVGLAVGVSVFAVGLAVARHWSVSVHGRTRTVIALVPLPTGDTARVRRADLAHTRLIPAPSGSFALELAHEDGRSTISGSAAINVAAILFRHVNRYGAPRELVQDAVAAIESRRSSETFMSSIARIDRAADYSTADPNPQQLLGAPVHGLFALSPVQRLACEMALHETSERCAFEGELIELQQRWREAEEIAAIADNLFLPAAVTNALQRLRNCIT